MRRFARLFALGAVLWCGGVTAQTPPSGFTECFSTSLAVVATSSNVQLQSCGPTVIVWNVGTSEVFIANGSTSATAAATTAGRGNQSVPPGTGIVINVGNGPSWLAGITADGATSTLRISSGSGFPAFVTAQSRDVNIVGPDGPEGGVSVAVIPFRKDASNDSGSITVGGAWQQVIPSNPLRQRIFLQNRCTAASQGIAASESVFLNLGPTMPMSTDGAIELTTCGVYDSSSFVLNTQPVWLFAASTGHKFVALEW